MQLSPRILGKTVVDQLTERSRSPVLRIGGDRFTRADLARVSCYNFTAAAALSHALEQSQVASAKELFETVPPAALILPHIGAIAISVLGAAFELKGVGGDQPLENWVRRHRPKGAPDDLVTVHTMKLHAIKERQAERRARRQGKETRSARRDQAHRLRVDRFLTRQGRRDA